MLMATDNQLKIGLDYHGVIDKKTDYFAKFCSEAKARNHLVYIITGGPKLKVEEALKKQNIQLYLLCKPDLEWEYDTVRENANNRQYLYNRYKKEVEKLSIPFFEISGLGEIRIKNAIEAVKSSFNYG